MLRSTYDYIRDNTIHMTGVVRHSSGWFTTGSFLENPKFNPATPAPVSVYCVHGTADSGGSFTLIATRMLNDLPEHIRGIHLLDFENRFKGNSNEDFAKQLKDKIKENKDENVILMGHSRGAVICALFAVYLAEINGVNIAAPVISICGPFKGSYAAVWPLTWLSTSVHQMSRDSDFLKDLSVKMQASSTKFHFFGAQKDMVVLSGCWFPYHIEHHEHPDCTLLDRHGHLSVMSSHRLVAKVKTVLFGVPEVREEPVVDVSPDASRDTLTI